MKAENGFRGQFIDEAPQDAEQARHWAMIVVDEIGR
jgi:hypothetical protein